MAGYSQQTLKGWKAELLLYGKIGHTCKYSNLGRAVVELGTLWSESRDLATAPTLPALFENNSARFDILEDRITEVEIPFQSQ